MVWSRVGQEWDRICVFLNTWLWSAGVSEEGEPMGRMVVAGLLDNEVSNTLLSGVEL